MRRLLKWAGYGLAGLVCLLVLAVIFIYIASSRIRARVYEIPLDSVELVADPAVAADGARLTALWGCEGCHGEGVTGDQMFEQRFVGSVTAPNLTRILPLYSDAELDRLLRRGIKRDGTSAMVMPAEVYYHIPEAQLSSIVAHLRSLPAAEGPEGGVKLGVLGRAFLVLGRFPLAAEEVDLSSPRMAYPGEGDPRALGEYWAAVICSLCHGEDLRGAEDDFAPSLEVVATSYSPAQFELFMRAGIAMDGRERELMSELARSNLRHMSREDIAGLYTYLTSELAGP